MRFRVWIPFAVMGVALAQGPVTAQPQPDFAALKGYLNLTGAQSLRPEIRDKFMALEDLLDKDNADVTQVGRAMLGIRSLEKQLRQAQKAVRSSELSVLTGEQRTKFKAIQDAADLPAAMREAQRLGLVTGPPPPPGQPGPGGER